MAKHKVGRRRERLEDDVPLSRSEKIKEGLRKARASRPRGANGKIIPKYRAILDNPPVLIGPVSKTYGGETSIHRDPAFIREPVLRERILKFITQGFPYTTVCNYVGVKHSTFLSWLEKGKAGLNSSYIKFYRAVCRAEAKGEMAILRKLRRHASSDWRVSAWQLERIWPEKYGRVDRIRAETRATISVTTDGKKNLGSKVLQDDVARELARRMIDGDAQLHFNALPAPEKTNA